MLLIISYFFFDLEVNFSAPLTEAFIILVRASFRNLLQVTVLLNLDFDLLSYFSSTSSRCTVLLAVHGGGDPHKN